MRRREFITLIGGAAATWPIAGRAQQPTMPVIGFLNTGSPEPYAHLLTALRGGLAEIGLVENRDYTMDQRWGHGRPAALPDLAADLVRRKVGLIVASPGGPARAARVATKDIPIVFGVGNDPVELGLVESLGRPGGNATGVYFFLSALSAKRLSVLREVVPNARRLALLVDAAGVEAGLTRAADVAGREAEAAAAAMGLALQVFDAQTNAGIDAAFAAISQKSCDGLVVSAAPLFTSRRVQLVSLAMRYRLPTIFPSREFADVGGLLSYGSKLSGEYRKMGVYAGRILKGVKPTDLPVEQSSWFELIVNQQTAKVLGLAIPPGLLAIADEVIE